MLAPSALLVCLLSCYLKPCRSHGLLGGAEEDAREQRMQCVQRAQRVQCVHHQQEEQQNMSRTTKRRTHGEDDADQEKISQDGEAEGRKIRARGRILHARAREREPRELM